MDQQKKKQQIERIFDALNRRAYDELDGILHPDYVDHPVMADVRGVEGFKRNLKGWLDAFPDGAFEARDIIVDGQLAAWRQRFVGTHTGSLWGTPPTGRHVDVLGVHMGRFAEDGRPIEHWVSNDVLSLMHQLGIPLAEVASGTP